MDNMINQIVQGDCLDVMKRIDSGSIDMILCDLPYGTTRLKWDSVIPVMALWAQYKRIIRHNGAIVLTANQPFASRLITSNPDEYKYSWYWIKPFPTGFLNANYRPMLVVEEALVFSKAGAGAGSKSNSMKYFPQGLTEINRKKINKKGKRGQHIHNTVNVGNNNVLNSEREYEQRYTDYPQNVIEFDRDSPQLHPTQKPLAMFEYLIRTYTNENDLVLDNCIGSGTTAIAALNTNRRFIGIELDENYHQIAVNRVNEWYREHELQKEEIN